MHRLPAEQRTAESAAGRSHRERCCGFGYPMGPNLRQWQRLHARPCVRAPTSSGRDTCRGSYEDLKLEWGRYQMWLTWLEWCTECTGWTLVSDARDVFFQRSPFAGDQCFDESVVACCMISACCHCAMCEPQRYVTPRCALPSC